jgi:hypothetical protein
MAPQPLLDLPPFIATASPVIGVSEQAQVKVVLRLDRSLKNIFINPQLLRSPSNLRANILEAIFFQKHYVNEDAQKFREHQVQLMISELARVAKLSLWDVEATMLAVKVQQAAASVITHCCARNSLVSLGRGQRGDIDRLVLNSMGVHDSRELERSIVDAAHQGHQKVRELQEAWPFSELGLL